MDVYQVSVRFSRKVQVKDYEPVEGDITLSANLHPGDDFGAEANRLMTMARQTVLDGLRGGPAATGTTDKPAEPKPAETTAQAADPKAGETPVVRRGPKTKAEKEAAAAAEAAAKTSTGAQISTGGERVNPQDEIPDDTAAAAAAKPAATQPATAASDIPDETAGNKAAAEAKPAAVTAKDGDDKLTADTLQSHITKLVQAKKVPVQKVKDILAAHGVQRTSEIPEGDIQTVKDEIDMAAMA